MAYLCTEYDDPSFSYSTDMTGTPIFFLNEHDLDHSPLRIWRLELAMVNLYTKL